MQNEKKYIRYKGITRLPSDHDAFDGELEDVVNMSITGGELRPVLPPELIGTIPGQFIFVHKNQGFEHFLSLDGNTVKAYKLVDGAFTLIGKVASILASVYSSICAVGNTVIITGTTGVIYSLWKQSTNAYVDLGSDIPFPVINFGLAPYTIPGTLWNKSFYINASDTGQLNYLNYLKTTEGTYLKTDAVSIDNSISDVSDKFVEQLREWLGWRLGDEGASVMGSAFEGAIKEAQGVITNKIMGIINAHISDQTENQRHIFPFLVRYALRLFDGSLVKHSPPFLMTPTRFIPFKVGPTTLAQATADGIEANKEISILLYNPSKLTYSHSISALSSYSDIVRSIDIFITPPIYTFAQDGILNGWVSDQDNPSTYLFGGMYKSRDAIRKSIAEASNFFLVHSIPVSEMSQAKNQAEVPMEKLNTLTSQMPMEDDYLSHDKIMATGSHAYNHKLHLFGIKSRPFGGFKYTNGSQVYEISDYGRVGSNEALYVGQQAYMFYPNARAKEVVSFTSDVANGANEIRIPLTEHKYLNGAFYLSPDLFPPSLGSVDDNFQTNFHVESRSGTIYISAHQNPFVFPVSSRITLPVGEVLAVSSNTEAISQGQFGQFPLYAFTDDGIWALEINNEGKYMARQPVSRDVVINPNIMQMDKALAFVTGKGLTLLSGVDTETISEIIRENNIRSSKISITGVISALEDAEMLSVDIGTDLMGAYASVPFETFSAGADLAYDYITGGGRILVINPLYDYMYVFDLATSTWSKVLGSYKRIVNNYPDSYVQDGDGKVYNLAHIPDAASTKTTCMIITRPISYEDYNFVIRSLAHRGIFKSALNVVIYASRNGVDYAPIMHRREKLIRMNGSGFRYYKLLVIADLDPNETLSGIEVDFMLKYPNRMR